MKDQMQYIVIEGRKPQDNSKPAQALLILPKWISPTLACAGIVGRVIELTDGNIIEQGAVYMGEQETLENLRIDIQQDLESQLETDDRHEQELRAEGVVAPVAATDEAEPNALDNAYREGMQATRDKLAGLLLQFGMPTDAKVPNWLKEQLEELAQFRKDRPETLARLQAAEDNLDAWRDAAGTNDKIHQYTDEKTGRITRLAVAVEGGGKLMDQYQALQEDFNEAQGDIEALRAQLRDTDKALLLIRKTAKKALKGTL